MNLLIPFFSTVFSIRLWLPISVKYLIYFIQIWLFSPLLSFACLFFQKRCCSYLVQRTFRQVFSNSKELVVWSMIICIYLQIDLYLLGNISRIFDISLFANRKLFYPCSNKENKIWNSKSVKILSKYKICIG